MHLYRLIHRSLHHSFFRSILFVPAVSLLSNHLYTTLHHSSNSSFFSLFPPSSFLTPSPPNNPNLSSVLTLREVTMNSPIFAAALLATLLAVAYATPSQKTMDVVMAEASPDPMVDPMMTPTTMPAPAIPELYLEQAGSPPFTIKPKKLKAGSIVPICPRTFGGRGFSIRCHVNAPKVFFRINRKPHKSERRPPFYLNGDRKGRIYAFRNLNKARVLRIGCKVPGKPEVWVQLVRVCKF